MDKNFSFSIEENELEINIKNIFVNKYIILFIDNCDFMIRLNGKELSFCKGEFVFIERGVNFSCRIIKKNPLKNPFSVIKMDRSQVLKLKNVMTSVYSHLIKTVHKKRSTESKIIRVKGDKILKETYYNILNREDDYESKVLQIAYFISLTESKTELINSLYSSLMITFTDKIKKLIESEPEKQWRLNLIAETFNIAEVSVRKRLLAEETTFNQILIDVRMHIAMQFILDNDCQMSQVAKKVGISTPSYFIQKFKEYYGVTPKQFLIYFRN